MCLLIIQMPMHWVFKFHVSSSKAPHHPFDLVSHFNPHMLVVRGSSFHDVIYNFHSCQLKCSLKSMENSKCWFFLAKYWEGIESGCWIPTSSLSDSASKYHGTHWCLSSQVCYFLLSRKFFDFQFILFCDSIKKSFSRWKAQLNSEPGMLCLITATFLVGTMWQSVWRKVWGDECNRSTSWHTTICNSHISAAWKHSPDGAARAEHVRVGPAWQTWCINTQLWAH
jgi:hypothetical protein